MGKTTILIELSEDDLRNLLEDAFDKKLREYFISKPPQIIESTEYLTRKEVCSLLRIALSTLHFYSKSGFLKGYRIGGRVLYKTNEVQKSIQEIQSTKYKHRAEESR